jgi:hypothetical protein
MGADAASVMPGRGVPFDLDAFRAGQDAAVAGKQGPFLLMSMADVGFYRGWRR